MGQELNLITKIQDMENNIEIGVDYYENAQLKYKITFVNGVKNGISKTWHENGQLKEEVSYIDNKRESILKSWYENGNINHELIYLNGKWNGYYKTWNEGGILTELSNGIHGKEFGITKYWYDNGCIKQEVFRDWFSFLGIFQSGHDNGTRNVIETYTKNRSSIRSGPTIAFKYTNSKDDSDELIGMEGGFDVRHLENESFDYYDNGQFMYRIPFHNKKRHGLARWWHKNGQVQRELNYVDGLEQGLSKEWYENGLIQSETNWLNGLMEGTFKRWYQNGDLNHVQNYKKGSPDGKHILINTKSIEITKDFYLNGEQHGLFEGRFGDGRRKKIKQYKVQLINGLNIRFRYEDDKKSLGEIITNGRINRSQ